MRMPNIRIFTDFIIACNVLVDVVVSIIVGVVTGDLHRQIEAYHERTQGQML